jgi:hypothetical protein
MEKVAWINLEREVTDASTVTEAKDVGKYQGTLDSQVGFPVSYKSTLPLARFHLQLQIDCHNLMYMFFYVLSVAE